ncbi:MAG: LysR family transcriptional regulator [Bacteriovoracaceae bacterium]
MKLNNINLNQFKCFQAVAEKGSLQEGAKCLNLTTSAVHQAIKKLESELKVHLFFRSGKNYIVTEEGRKLLALFQHFLWDLLQFSDQANPQDEGLSGEIRIGLPLNFSKYIFVPIMKEFNLLYPEVSFHLTIAETGRLLEGITRFELDFAITDDSFTDEASSKIVKHQIFKEELMLVCSQKFAKANAQELSNFSSLKKLPHLCYAKNLPIVQRWYQTHFKKQIKFSHFHSIDNVETMVAALKSGMGLGVIPSDLLRNNTQLQKELFIVQLKDKNLLFNHLFLVQEANYIPNNLVKKFIHFFNQEIAKL